MSWGHSSRCLASEGRRWSEASLVKFRCSSLTCFCGSVDILDRSRDAFLASDWLPNMTEGFRVIAPYYTLHTKQRLLLCDPCCILALKTYVNGIRILCYASLLMGPTKARTILLPALPERPSRYITLVFIRWQRRLCSGRGAGALAVAPLLAATLPDQTPTKVL